MTAEWPKRYHPATFTDEDGYVVDESTTVEGFQLRPDTWDTLTAWCDGVRILDDAGMQAVAVNNRLTTPNVAKLGDFVMRAPDRWTVSRADGHYQRWAEQTSERRD